MEQIRNLLIAVGWKHKSDSKDVFGYTLTSYEKGVEVIQIKYMDDDSQKLIGVDND